MKMSDKVETHIKNLNIKKINKDKNKTWDEYFMETAFLVSQRSSCTHRKVGAVIVKDKRILATGYNQPPSGFPHCDEIGCIRDDLEITSGEYQEVCYGLHAEQNALMQAAKFGIRTDGAFIYVTHQPCSVCARLIINAGIKKVIYRNPYPDSLTKLIFEKTKVDTLIMG